MDPTDNQPEQEPTLEDIDKLFASEPAVEPKIKGQKLSKMPPGQMVTTIMDAAGVEMTPEERASLEVITDDEAMKAFLDANLGKEPYIDEYKARSLFGSYMMRKIDVKSVGFATRLMNVRSTQQLIEFAIDLTRKPGATIEEQTNAAKLWLLGNRELSVMLKRFEELGQELAPNATPPKGKNKAPDILITDSQVILGTPSS